MEVYISKEIFLGYAKSNQGRSQNNTDKTDKTESKRSEEIRKLTEDK